MAHATESAHMGWGARQIGAGTAKMTVDGGKTLAGAGNGNAVTARGCVGLVVTATARCGSRVQAARGTHAWEGWVRSGFRTPRG